jgi:hypothetical protein
LARPLGAYFRVNHRDVVSMHSALAEVGVLYATSQVHTGWQEVKGDGIIHSKGQSLGGHAFAIVGFSERGFWIQNSWGPTWGRRGFALLSYEDWLECGMDCWVARLGAPVATTSLRAAADLSSNVAGQGGKGTSYADLRPHVISLANDGRLDASGPFGMSKADVERIVREDVPRVTNGWEKKRLLLYAHGGLVNQDSALQRLAEYRATLIGAQVYPVTFVWKTDFWTTVKNVLSDAIGRRRTEGPIESAKDFMLDRLDDALEPVARSVGGKLFWDEMKENALAATEDAAGGARFFVETLLAHGDPRTEIHLAGHSAGAWLLAPLARMLAKRGRTIRTATFLAPAITQVGFDEYYLPLVKQEAIEDLALFTLSDRAEQDDHCANIYNKSLLYLVSNAFEAEARIPFFRDGVPLIGMEKFLAKHGPVREQIDAGRIRWVMAPNHGQEGSPSASSASSHGGFDNDKATLLAILARVTGGAPAPTAFPLRRSAQGIAAQRRELNMQSR